MEMVNKEKKGFDSFKFGLFMLAIGLFITNTKILYHLNPDGSENAFSYKMLNENSIISMIIASVYSITTISIISKLRKMDCFWYIILIMIFPFALIDGYGVHLYYNTKMPNFIIFAAIYYGIYTTMILLFPAFEKMIKDKFTKKKTSDNLVTDNNNTSILNDTIEKLNVTIEILKNENEILKNQIENNPINNENNNVNFELQKELFIKFYQVDKLLINEKKGRTDQSKLNVEKLEIIRANLIKQLNICNEIENINKDVLLPVLFENLN